jgi:hypothetical protein
MLGGTFTNGSFEDPGGNTPGVRCPYDNSGCAATGWVSTGGFQVWESAPNDGLSAGADGIFWVSFGHSGATGGTLEQTFDTVIGTAYNVAFSVVVQQGIDPESVLAEALDGSTTIGSSFLNGGGANWGLDAVTVDAAVAGGVPEPASLTLFGGALLALAIRRRRPR